jgi:hypothetical protein
MHHLPACLTSSSLLSAVQSKSHVASSVLRAQLGAVLAPVTSGRQWWKERLLGDSGPLLRRELPSTPLPELPSTLLAAAGQNQCKERAQECDTLWVKGVPADQHNVLWPCAQHMSLWLWPHGATSQALIRCRHVFEWPKGTNQQH